MRDMAQYFLADSIRFHRILKALDPYSIVSLYHKQVNPQMIKGSWNKSKEHYHRPNVNFKVLSKIVEEKSSGVINQLAIHLRLGDCYGKSQSVEKYIRIIKRNEKTIKTKNCRIYCCLHKKINAEKSSQFVVRLGNRLREEGFNVKMPEVQRANGWYNVDRDFVEIASSKYLIAGKRGFGWLAACMNKNYVFWGAYKMFGRIPDFRWERESQDNYNLLEGFLFQQKRSYLNRS